LSSFHPLKIRTWEQAELTESGVAIRPFLLILTELIEFGAVEGGQLVVDAVQRLVMQNDLVSQQEIDDYLANLEEPKRTTLQELRQTIHNIVPEAEQGISYGMPAFRLHGRVIAGFAAFKNHLSYLPHRGSVFAELPDDVAGYVTSKGALQFPIDKPLPKALVKKLIAARLREVL
jgi:uncharacterized protein YdhG (YjbR/CyaY superfamily)